MKDPAPAAVWTYKGKPWRAAGRLAGPGLCVRSLGQFAGELERAGLGPRKTQLTVLQMKAGKINKPGSLSGCGERARRAGCLPHWFPVRGWNREDKRASRKEVHGRVS